MNILVINCGSSSIKAELFNCETQKSILEGAVSHIGKNSPTEIEFEDKAETVEENNFSTLLKTLLEKFVEKGEAIDAVGHRVVHGGEKYREPIKITNEIFKDLKSVEELAPLHNPINLKGIEIARETFSSLSQVAVFDTGFHASLPEKAYTYAIDKTLAKKHGLRRYGFHGISHDYVAHKAAEALGQPLKDLKLITCHLGNGASVAAVEFGKSVETSMGLTPVEGLVMGTRAGDLDAGLLISLMEKENLSTDEIDKFVNKKSGLLGVSGTTNDMRKLEELAAEGDTDSRLAIQVFTHRLLKYIGAYSAVMNGVDAIIFTGGIGENSSTIRDHVCQKLDYLGIQLDQHANHTIRLSDDKPVEFFSERTSRVHLMAIKTNEQLNIANQTKSILEGKCEVKAVKTIPIGISGRHCHLTQETVEILFGKGYQLTEKKPLSQPNQFAANETVELIGPKNTLKVRILGPTRPKNQVEISRTDEFFVGIDAPIRDSGNVSGSAGCILKGPKGEVEINEGVICAWRHIHMTTSDAEEFGVKNKDIVEVKIDNPERPLTFGNVLVRVSDKYALEMHIDTDEANAAELSRNAEGEIVMTGESVTLVKRELD